MPDFLMTNIRHIRLYLDHNRQDHRATLGFGKEELTHSLTDLIAYHFPVKLHTGGGTFLHDVLDFALGLIDEVEIFFHVNEAA